MKTSQLYTFSFRNVRNKNKIQTSSLSKEEVWRKFQEKKVAEAVHDPTDISKLKYKDTSQHIDENMASTPRKSIKNIYKDNTTRGLVNMLLAFIFCLATSKFVAQYIFQQKW